MNPILGTLPQSLSPIDLARGVTADLTMPEKARQLCVISPALLVGPDGTLDEESAELLLGAGIGAVFPLPAGSDADDERAAVIIEQIQRFLVERTRAGIPAAFFAEPAYLSIDEFDAQIPFPLDFCERLLQDIDAGTVDPLVVERAVERVLAEKIAMGLFDKPFDARPQHPATLPTPRGGRLSLEPAAEAHG